MRFTDIQNLGGCAGFDEFLEYLSAAMLRILDLAVEFAIAEKTGAAFAELDVGFRVERFLPPEVPGVLRALTHRLASLQNNRPKPQLSQRQRSEQSAGSESNHQRTIVETFRRRGGGVVRNVRCRSDLAVCFESVQHACLVAHLAVHGIDEAQLGILLARVVTASEHRELDESTFGQFQPGLNSPAKGIRWVPNRQREFRDSQHDGAGSVQTP